MFKDLARQVHRVRLPTWQKPKHGQQWLNTLRDYAFPKIGLMPVDEEKRSVPDDIGIEREIRHSPNDAII